MALLSRLHVQLAALRPYCVVRLLHARAFFLQPQFLSKIAVAICYDLTVLKPSSF
jgi:hypothetical protein